MQQLQLNSTLQGGKYIIKKFLGQGGFGITYLAEHELLGTKVAIKEFFMKEFNSRNEATSHVSIGTEGSRELVEKFKAKFLKEARNIARLKHPNIVRIQDVFEENGTAYYVMDYCEKGSLSDLIKQYPNGIGEACALKYIRQVASALQYIHEQKMNHLDVKPANILLDAQGNAVLIDFGLAKQYDITTGNQTSTTPVGISHGYAPMEQYKKGGVSEFSPATDIYSLGATLYKLITGQTPPEAQVLLEEDLPAFSASPYVVAAIRKAMQVRRSERSQSIMEWMNILGESSTSKTCSSESNSTVEDCITLSLDVDDESTRIEMSAWQEEEMRRQREFQAKSKAAEESRRHDAEEAERRLREEAIRRKIEEERKRTEERQIAEREAKAAEEARRRKENETKSKDNKKKSPLGWTAIIISVFIICGLLGLCTQSSSNGTRNSSKYANTERTVIIETIPAEAKVWLNNDYKGLTPLQLSLDNKVYNLTIEKDGYEKKVLLLPDKGEKFNYYLTKLQVSQQENLSVNRQEKPANNIHEQVSQQEKEPSENIPSKYRDVTFGCISEYATISIDGNYIGSIKKTVNLSYGTHKVEVKAPGYYNYVGKVFVDSNNNYFYFPLKRNSSEPLPIAQSQQSNVSTQQTNTSNQEGKINVQGSAFESSGEPLYGIVVRARKSNKEGSVDKNGYFRIENVTRGEELEIYVDGKKYTQTAQPSVRFTVEPRSKNTSVSNTSKEITVRGKIVDEGGFPILGATIIKKGSKYGVASDIDGNFMIQANENSELEVSYVKMKTATVFAQPTMKIVLRKK